MSKRLGKNCRLYYNAGSYNSPSWTPINSVRDNVLNQSKKEADASTRVTDTEITVGTMKTLSIDFDILEDTTAGEYTVLAGSYYNDTAVDMLILDGPVGTPGSRGVRAPMAVIDFTRGEKLDDMVTRKITMKPTISDNVPVAFLAV